MRLLTFLYGVFMQVILIYLLVILALRLLMLRCLHAFLFIPVVRKFVIQIFVMSQSAWLMFKCLRCGRA